MLGAHLDSWHPGTGATDNAAGSAVMMEALRILKAIDAKPRRTIRLGLWGGEEQGLLGSRAYVSEHFASRPERPQGPDELPSYMRSDPPAPMTLKPEHAKLSAYFNYDNGTGRIRGIYLQENAAAKPIFEAWMESVKDLGATRVTFRNTGGTDHQSFDSVGLPGFQFIQDEIEYDGRFFGTHHTSVDTYDRLQREDLMQSAVVVATFVYAAATRDEMLPRKPQPALAAPSVTAPALKPVKGASRPRRARSPRSSPARASRPKRRPPAAEAVGHRPGRPDSGPAGLCSHREPRARAGDQGPAAAEGHERPRHDLRRRDPVAHRPRLGGRGAQDGGPALGDEGHARGRVPRAGVPGRHRQLLHGHGARRADLDHGARVGRGRALGRRPRREGEGDRGRRGARVGGRRGPADADPRRHDDASREHAAQGRLPARLPGHVRDDRGRRGRPRGRAWVATPPTASPAASCAPR